jgi:3-oxoacyl-[acyl-carrier protein] reductase
MDLGLAGKRALVFGSSSGLGRAVAAELIAEGADVAVTSRGGEKLERAAKELGAAAALPGDLTQAGAGADLVVRAQQALGGLDILVTNCGGPPKASFLEIDDPTWEEAFRSIWMSVVDAMRAALPPMQKAGWGRVLLVTSSTGRETFPGLTISNALRPGLHGLVNSVSKEVAASGVTVNALMPGIIDTERLRELGIDTEAAAERVPVGRLGRPDELGALAAFLASDRASYITGQAFACDGGRMASI